MVRMFENNLTIDFISLRDALEKEGMLELSGGKLYLTQLAQKASSSANIIHHSKLLLEKWMSRELKLKSENVIKKIDEQSEDIWDIQFRAVTDFENIMNDIDSVSTNENNLWEDFQTTVEKVEELYSNKRDSGLVSKSFPSFNRMTGGIRENDFITIYGFEKQGKTTLTLQLMLDFAIHSKVPVGIFSLEMDKQSLYFKSWSLEAGIEYNKLRSPKQANLTPEEFNTFLPEAIKTFKDTKIYICDKVLDRSRIKARMKIWKRKYGIKIFAIDYISLIPSNEKYERRDLEIASLSRYFKLAAKELNTPIIMLSQSNQDGKVAESKALSRDADFVFSIKKPFEHGIKQMAINGRNFVFNEDHFLVTLEYSRHGRNLYNFICGYTKRNSFKEIDLLYENRNGNQYEPELHENIF